MKRKTTAVLLLQRSEWFDEIDHQEAIVSLDEDADRIALQLRPIIDVVKTRSISTVGTADAVSVELRSIETDLVILLYQTRVDIIYLERILRGIGNRPLVVWCYMPWRRIPSSLTYEDMVTGSGFYAMTDTITRLSALHIPYLAAFGSSDDPAVLSNIRDFALAAQVLSDLRKVKLAILTNKDMAITRLLSKAPFGVLGEPAEILPLSILRDYIDLVTDDEISQYKKQLASSSIESMVSDETLTAAAKIQLGLQHMAAQKSLDFLAMDDHDQEFRKLYGLCPGMPPLAHPVRKTIFTSTTHVDLVASNIVLSQISDSPVFTLRMWFWERAKNIIVGGYGGIQTPDEIAYGSKWIIGDYECKRGDPDGGAQVEFITKPGRVTLLQMSLSDKQIMARAVSGVCLESEPWIEGIPHTVVRLDCSIDHFLERIAEDGGSPFWVMVYGSHLAQLSALFELQSIPFEVLHD